MPRRQHHRTHGGVRRWLLWSLPIVICCGLLACAASRCASHALVPQSGDALLVIDDFEGRPAGVPPGPPWQHRTFGGVPPTEFQVVSSAGGSHLHGEAAAGASALTVAIDADPAELRRLRFRWRAPVLPVRADLSRRDGDDCALRVFVTFEYEPERASLGERLARSLAGGDLPGSSLCYVCTAHARAGSLLPNPFTDRAKMIVMPGDGSAWSTFECDLVADYERAFGHAPPRITGVGIMVDADQTGGRAAADIDDLELAQIGSPKGSATVGAPGVEDQGAPRTMRQDK